MERKREGAPGQADMAMQTGLVWLQPVFPSSQNIVKSLPVPFLFASCFVSCSESECH